MCTGVQAGVHMSTVCECVLAHEGGHCCACTSVSTVGACGVGCALSSAVGVCRCLQVFAGVGCVTAGGGVEV